MYCSSAFGQPACGRRACLSSHSLAFRVLALAAMASAVYRCGVKKMDIFRCGRHARFGPLTTKRTAANGTKRKTANCGGLSEIWSDVLVKPQACRFQAEGGGEEWQGGWGRGNSWNLKMGVSLRCKHGAGKKFYAAFTPDRG